MSDMLASTASTEPGSDPAGSQPEVALLDLLISLLAPLFVTATSGDIGFARAAALRTINAFRVSDAVDLLTVAHIIGFGLASLGSIGLSMIEDMPVGMVVRLRSNANALQRSTEQNRRALAHSRRAASLRGWTEEEARCPGPTEADVEAAVTRTRRLVAEAKAGLRMAAAPPAASAGNTLPPDGSAPRRGDRTGSADGQPLVRREANRSGLHPLPVPQMPTAAERPAATQTPAAPGGPVPQLSAAQSSPAPAAAAQPPFAPSTGQRPAPLPSAGAQPAARTTRAVRSAGALPEPAKQQPAAGESLTQDQQRRMMWASSMTRVAAEFLQELPALTPNQRKLNTVRANALSSTASQLILGGSFPGMAQPAEAAAPAGEILDKDP